MPNCFDRMHQYGEYPDGNDLQAIKLPDEVVDICDGDMLASTTVDNELRALKISDVSWSTDLAGTRVAAKAAFKGVALAEVDATGCRDMQTEIPIAVYRAGSKFTRSYRIVDASGAPTTAQWVRGQGFTFAKDPDGNRLLNDAVTASSTAGHIVFKAVKDSGPAQSRVEVEFSA